MRRRTALVVCSAAIAVGLAGAVAVPLVWGSSGKRVDPVPTIGAGAPTRLASESPPPVPTTAAPSRRSTTRPPSTSRHRLAPTTQSSHRSSPHRSSPHHAVTAPRGRGPGPVSITIPSVDIGAAVAPVGVDPTGDVAIPERVDQVGWYRFGAKPGMREGSTVLVGHVDSAAQGAGAFFRLHQVGKGATVRVAMPSGQVLRYRVIGRQLYVKGRVPLDDLFALTGAPRLTLITCGGSFDARKLSYRDNVVVTAVPDE